MTAREVFTMYFKFAAKDKPRYFLVLALLVGSAVASRLIPLFAGKVIDSIASEAALGVSLAVGGVIVLVLVERFLEIAGLWLSDKIIFEDLHKAGRMAYIQALQQVDYEYHTNKS